MTCYKGGLTVNNNYQMCDVTNKKILEILEGKIPQVTFSCKAGSKADEAETCDFQCKCSPGTVSHLLSRLQFA